MKISMVEVIIDAKKRDIENTLKNSEYVDDYEIEELDNKDIRKSVVIIFRDVVDSKFLDNVLKNILPEEIKNTIE